MPKKLDMILFNGEEARNNGWLFSIDWKKNCHGLHMKSDKETIDAIRKAIADKLSIDLDHIGQDLSISARGEPPIEHIGNGDYIFSHYKVGYTYIQDEDPSNKCLGGDAFRK